MAPPMLLFVSLSFFPSLLILTLFFSSILAGRSSKRTFYTKGFLVSLSGLAIGTAFALAAVILPGSVPVLDVSIAIAGVSWVLALRRICGTDWLEALGQAVIAAILYTVIIGFAAGFSFLLA